MGDSVVVVVAALINDDAAGQNSLDVLSLFDFDSIRIGPGEKFLGYLGHLSAFHALESIFVIEELAIDGVVVGARNVHGKLVLEDGEFFLDRGEFLPILFDNVLWEQLEQFLLDAHDLLAVLVVDLQIVTPGEDLSFDHVEITLVVGIGDLEVVSPAPEFFLDLVGWHGVDVNLFDVTIDLCNNYVLVTVVLQLSQER